MENHGETPPSEEFAKLAAEHSECPSAQKGGKLGIFMRDAMEKPFEEASFNTKPGKLHNGIVETKHGFHIILVEEHR